MDVYVKNFKPGAPQWEINLVGRIVVLIGAVLAIVMTVAIDAIKGLNLFNVFQSVLGFIAPPMASVFLLGIFWKRCTARAANVCLTACRQRLSDSWDSLLPDGGHPLPMAPRMAHHAVASLHAAVILSVRHPRCLNGYHQSD